MEKQVINIESIESITIKFNGQNIKVRPYIDLETKTTLMKYYTETMIGENNLSARYLTAIYSLILGVIDLQTDINIENLSIDDIINSGLWDQIKYHITNYDEFKNEINEVVKLMREDIALQKSMSQSFDNLVFNITNFLNKISEIDLSKEGVTKILEALNEQKNEYNKIVNPSQVMEVSKTRKKKELLQ